MMTKDIDICKRVILDSIENLKTKEDESEFAKDKCKCMKQRLTLLKALEIITDKDSEDAENNEELTFVCDCCEETYNMKDRNVLFGRELCPDCYI